MDPAHAGRRSARGATYGLRCLAIAVVLGVVCPLASALAACPQCQSESCFPLVGCFCFPDSGTPCDDGQVCTEADTCAGGLCFGAPRDCSGVGDQCTVGVCSEPVGCITQPKPDLIPCDDGKLCTVNDACMQGVCTGPPFNCSATSDACNDGICSEQAEGCVKTPKADDTPCDDGGVCTVTDACHAGQCVGSPATGRVCRAPASPCDVEETCEAANKDCPPDVFAVVGTSCVDGDPCTFEDTCSTGACSGGVRVCSADVTPEKRRGSKIPRIVVDCMGNVEGPCEAVGLADAPAGSDALRVDGPGAADAVIVRRLAAVAPGTRLTSKKGARRTLSGGRARLVLRLNAAGKKQLRQLGSLSVKVVVTVSTTRGPINLTKLLALRR